MPDPKPGTPGGKMIGEAERQRLENPDPGPSAEIESESRFVKEAERLLGKPISKFSDNDFLRLPIKLVARNVSVSTELSVEMKDPAMDCRWFNKKDRGGQRVQHARFLGFEPCTKDDIAACHATATDDSGALVMGDLVLMKISKVRLRAGFYKENAEKAKYRVSQAAARPFSVSVPGVDNASSVIPQVLQNQTELLDPEAARAAVFGR